MVVATKHIFCWHVASTGLEQVRFRFVCVSHNKDCRLTIASTQEYRLFLTLFQSGRRVSHSLSPLSALTSAAGSRPCVESNYAVYGLCAALGLDSWLAALLTVCRRKSSADLGTQTRTQALIRTPLAFATKW